MRNMQTCPLMIELYDHQVEALKKLHNGSVLCGDVGSGKSRTALAYYFINQCGGNLKINGSGSFKDMTDPRDLYIITTAKKRDSLEWLKEAAPFCLDNVKVTVDSWNNIKKYDKVFGAFFIFDEQRVVGYGAWTKAFLKITRKNKWILLSATPGDTWSDYIPLFIANGFYKNKTEFNEMHVVFNRFSKYPKIDRYVDTGILVKHRNDILVRMEDQRTTHHNHINVPVEYNKKDYLTLIRKRWDPYDNEPIAETGKLFYLMRRIVNEDTSRIDAVDEILRKHPKVIIFYNFTYELELLRNYLCTNQIVYREWNGEKHEELPTGNSWAYLVQYSAGAEGWNCISTDTIIFYSQSYSYRMTIQAAGRIDRMNTPFKELYFYHLVSAASIDIAIRRALAQKRNFNEKSFKI